MLWCKRFQVFWQIPAPKSTKYPHIYNRQHINHESSREFILVLESMSKLVPGPFVLLSIPYLFHSPVQTDCFSPRKDSSSWDVVLPPPPLPLFLLSQRSHAAVGGKTNHFLACNQSAPKTERRSAAACAGSPQLGQKNLLCDGTADAKPRAGAPVQLTPPACQSLSGHMARSHGALLPVSTALRTRPAPI